MSTAHTRPTRPARNGSPILRAALAAFALVALFQAHPARADGEIAEAARTAYETLQARMDTATGLDRAVIAHQLGVWTRNPVWSGLDSWNDRSEALFELSLMDAGRYDLAGQPAPIPPTGDDHYTPPHWTKGLRDLRHALVREDFDRIASAYYARWPGLLDPVRWLATGDLAARRHDLDSALVSYRRALDAAEHPFLRAEIVLAAGRALYRQQHFQAALDTLVGALKEGGLSDDLLYETGSTLVRLGRMKEAVALFELTVTINPLHERGHYMLGNGYTAMTYAQLAEARPACLPDSAQERTLKRADQLLRRGFLTEANDLAEVVIAAAPGNAPARVMAAEIAWLQGDFATAETHLLHALSACAEYGRAHAVLARVQESRRLRASPRRMALRDRAIATPMPEVPGIGRYVINWEDLARRHRKQVALAVQPWAHFVPVLDASGATHYIKPMHERLSDAPFMESLRGQRIGLDGRLWDDVRGAGGHHTVTGIEDVNRLLYGGYNTVVHELTHQVHGLLTDPEKERIETLYRQAKLKEAEGNKTFLSRYQASTVWEYFAEGVNAYVTPRIDEYDEREMVRERLEELDPDLLALVEHFLSVEEMEPYYAVGAVNGAFEELEKGRASEALARLRAIEAPHDTMPAVLRATSHVASLLDADSLALALGRRSVQLHPLDGESHLVLAGALRTASPEGAREAEQVLSAALAQDSLAPRHEVHLALGGYLLRRGKPSAALARYDSVLARQQDHPAALWGRGEAQAELAFTGGAEDPDSALALAREAFQQAVLRRSGWVALRLAWARVLLEAGRLEEAEAQIEEAEALRPDAPEPVAYRAWLHGLRGDSLEARILLRRALTLEPVPDDVTVLSASYGIGAVPDPAALADSLAATAPSYEYNPREYGYMLRGELEPWHERLLRGARPARFPVEEEGEEGSGSPAGSGREGGPQPPPARPFRF